MASRGKESNDQKTPVKNPEALVEEVHLNLSSKVQVLGDVGLVVSR